MKCKNGYCEKEYNDSKSISTILDRNDNYIGPKFHILGMINVSLVIWMVPEISMSNQKIKSGKKKNNFYNFLLITKNQDKDIQR